MSDSKNLPQTNGPSQTLSQTPSQTREADQESQDRKPNQNYPAWLPEPYCPICKKPATQCRCDLTELANQQTDRLVYRKLVGGPQESHRKDIEQFAQPLYEKLRSFSSQLTDTEDAVFLPLQRLLEEWGVIQTEANQAKAKVTPSQSFGENIGQKWLDKWLGENT